MAYLLTVIVVLVVVNLLNNWLAPRAYLVTSLIATGLLLLLFRQAGFGLADAGLAPDTALHGAVWGMAGAALVAVGCLITALLPGTRQVFADRRGERAGPGEIAYQVLVRIPFGTVLLEEVAFRGVLYGLLSVEYGAGWATAVSSALFGLWHVLPSLPLTRLNAAAGRAFGGHRGRVVVVAVVGTALAGVVLCGLRQASGSLLAPMAVHWATNGLGLVTAFLVARRGSTLRT